MISIKRLLTLSLLLMSSMALAPQEKENPDKSKKSKKSMSLRNKIGASIAGAIALAAAGIFVVHKFQQKPPITAAEIKQMIERCKLAISQTENIKAESLQAIQKLEERLIIAEAEEHAVIKQMIEQFKLAISQMENDKAAALQTIPKLEEFLRKVEAI